MMVAMFVVAVISVFGLLSSSVDCHENDILASKIVQTLRLGIKMASTFANPKGSQIVSSVLERLSKGSERFEKDSDWKGRKELLPVFLRLMGIDSSKVGDYAFGGFILLSHLISQLLTTDEKGNRRERRRETFSPFQFTMSQPLVSGLLTQMKDPNLVDLILKEGSQKLEGYPSEDVDCIRVLICKTSPFVRGMQKSLRFFTKREESKGDVGGQEARRRRNVTGTCKRNGIPWRYEREERCEEGEEGKEEEEREEKLWEKSNLEERMYFFLPTLDEVVERGDECDERFPNCVY